MSVLPIPSGNKLFDQSPRFLSCLKRIIKSDWLNVLKSLTSIKKGKLTLKDETIKNFEMSEDPASSAIDYMISKAIVLDELFDAFETLGLEEGLLFLNKPVTDIEIIQRPPSVVFVNSSEKLRVVCQAIGFPTPTYEYYKDDVSVAMGAEFMKDVASSCDSGRYKCLIKQRRGAEVIVKELNFKVIVKSGNNLDILKVTLPVTQQVMINETVSISATTNIEQSRLKFEWYKVSDKFGSQEVKLVNNATACTSTLVFEKFEMKQAGVYRCQVSLIGTDLRVVSRNSELVPILSQFDLKIALIIGNSNYEPDDEEIKFCKKCTNMTPSYNLTNLNICSAFETLKPRLEELGYLVMSFLDVDVDGYLRALHMAREVCDRSKSVSVLIYVGGHGHNYVKEDFLIPIDTKKMLHNNNHEYRRIYSSLNLCSLSNLLANFKPTSPSQNISVVCFWDLCRRTWIECPSDIDPSYKENLNYSIMFCCNIGLNGFEINVEDEELNLRKGPIFLNVLLNNLKKNMTLHEIGIKMKQDIQLMKEKRPHFDKLNNLSLFSTLENHELSVKANKNEEFEPLIGSMYIPAEDQQRKECIENGAKVLAYRFLPDVFINSLLLEIETLTSRPLNYTVKYQTLIFMDQIESNRPNIVMFRIRNFLAAKRLNLNLPIILMVTHSNTTKSLEIRFPDHIHKLHDRMSTEDIERCIYERKMLDLSDAMSVSSIDEENESESFTDTNSIDDFVG